MLPSTAYLLSDAFRQSLQFSTVTPAAPHSPAQHATIDHNTLDHAQLAHAIKTGGPHQFPEAELPKIGMRLRRSGQFTAADTIDNHAKAIQAAKQPPAAPVAQRPNLPAYAGVLSPNRKKAVMDFVNHANPDVQKHVADHQVHVPGLTPKDAYARAQKAYDTFHAAHMGVPLATAPAPASAPQPTQKPSRTGMDQSEIARRMGLNPGPHPPEPSMDWKKSDAPLPMPQAPAQTPAAPAPQSPVITLQPIAKQTPSDVAKMHAEAVRSGRPVPPQYLDRVQKNLRAHGYHAEADQIAPKQDDAAYAADQFGSGTIPATTGITGAGSNRPGAPAPQRSFLNDESTGGPAKLPPRRPAPANTPAEPLPAPKFGYSSHLQNTGLNRFNYESMDNSGIERSGTINANDEAHAHSLLKKQGHFVTKLQQHGGSSPVAAMDDSEESQPSTHGRFSQLLDAARQGKLKEHVEGGLGKFFDKFERHGGKLLKKIGIDTGYNGEQEYSRVSAAIANLNDIVQEFARKSDPNQMSLFGGDEIALATAPKSKARSLRKLAPGQKSFNWDEDSHPREKDHHDGKRPGEFAPKESGHTSDTKPEAEPEEPAEKPESEQQPDTKRTYSAKGNEVHDADGVRHGAFRNEEKAKEAAERWNREGKPNSTPAAKAVEAKFPSLAGYVEPESPREELKKIADEHLASEIPPAQNPVSGPKADSKKETASTDDQPNYANLPADDGSDPDAPKGDDDEYGPVKDFGEKIGGARKDRAVERGSSAKKEKSGQPAWMKRYIIAPVATGANAGKFTIINAKDGRAALRGIYLDSREQAEALLPAVEVQRKHDVRNVAKQGEPDNWAVIRHVNDRKRPVIKGGFKTSAEATGYMVEHAAEILATNTRITNAIHPAMENVTREGPTHRPNGKHATEGDFGKFGFRGVEFGKWVNQAEGRHILDHAYDSLVDMADAIGVPAKALSLDGELGLGFGSRGHGNAGWGGAANAHYERHYGAINITKLHGAGSLAHEWMHAVDHWLGRKSGKASDQKILNKYNDDVFKAGEASDDFVSHGTPRRPKEGFRAEVSAAIEGVRDAITSRDVKYKEDQSTHEKIQKRRTEELSKQLAGFRESMARDYSKDKYQHYKGKRGLPASPEVMKEIDEISAKMLAGDYGANVQHGESSPDTPANKSNWGHTMPAHVARLADLHKQLRGNKGYSATKGYGGTSIHGIIADVKTAAMMHRTGLANLKEAKEQKEKTGKVRSEFYSHAGAMDQGQDGDYWSTPHEMMARAFEAYVYDKLEAKKGHNDFLAYEKHNDRPEYRMFNVKPYPEGDERPKINAAFDHLFSVLSKHEMDGTHRSTAKRVDRVDVDTKTWKGYLKATDSTDSFSGIEARLKGRDGIMRFTEKKGAPTKYEFFSKPPGSSIEDWEKRIKTERKSGKFFVIQNGEQQFSRASSLDTALSRLTALSSSLRNAS